MIGQSSSLGFHARPLRLEIENLRQLRLPCILHWNLNHFVVLASVGGRSALLFDPAAGERRLSLDEFSRHFTGIALELTPRADFTAVDNAPRISLRSLTGHVSGLRRSLLQIFAVAAALELFALAAPIFNQLIVDEAIAAQDRDLLGILVLGFFLLLLVQVVLAFMRKWMVMVLGQNLSLQWLSNVFAHLVKLPTSWFEQRHLGDVISRFGAVRDIQKTLTSSVVEALLDGLMGLAALVLMWLYSSRLTAIVVAAVLLYALLRWAAYRPFQQAAAERLVVASRESTHFIETLRAITALKLFGREGERQARWQNLAVEVQNRDALTARMNLAFSSANALLFGAENLLVFWVGAGLVMEGLAPHPAAMAAPFTVGMLFAFISYKTQFSSRLSALIDYAVELRMLRLHSARLADIVLTPPEPDDVQTSDLDHLTSSLELRGVSFRYGDGEPWILKDLNVVIMQGQSVVIVGASGCGKTTLLKIALGLLSPTEGVVLYGGMPIRQLGLGNFRRLIGTVMQEDSLLAGSIAENIGFFDVNLDMDRVKRCASLVQIHEEISRMPMSYNTLVGDMGSSLSGGQKQRVLLARAIYKQPRVLALDEATSHLDIDNEKRITSAIRGLNITRIVVAHRPETIAGADQVLSLCQGQIQRNGEAPIPPK